MKGILEVAKTIFDDGSARLARVLTGANTLTLSIVRDGIMGGEEVSVVSHNDGCRTVPTLTPDDRPFSVFDLRFRYSIEHNLKENISHGGR